MLLSDVHAGAVLVQPHEGRPLAECGAGTGLRQRRHPGDRGVAEGPQLVAGQSHKHVQYGIATTHIKRQLISGDNSYQFEKATTHIMFANRVQIPKFYFKNKLLTNMINCN